MAAADGTRERRKPEEGPGGHSGSTPSKAGSGDRAAERGDRSSAWHRPRNGSTPSTDKGLSLPAALRGVEEAAELSEWALRCAGAALEHPAAGRGESEAVLSKLSTWLTSPAQPQVISQMAAAGIPAVVVRSMRKLRNEPPTAALACVVAARSSGSTECALAHVRAGALEEAGGLMDRHPAHGGVQNVCLLLLCALLKDHVVARQAVAGGTVARVLRAMEATEGREVQYNGLSALRLLADQGRAPRAGLQEAALRAKVAHSSDGAVCSAANHVLSVVTPRFKEVLCWHWQSGWCKLGPRCTYAHGPSDLRGG